MKTLLALLLLSPALVAQPLFAQSLSTQSKSKPGDVVIQQVNDRRTSGSFAQLTISLELPGVKASEVAATRVLLTTAVDDSGKTLLDPKAREPQLESTSRMSMKRDDAPPATISVTLLNPARKATKVKEIRGDIELYMPSRDPNSIAEIPKFLSYSGKQLASKALAANSVEIGVVSPTQLAAEKKRRGDAKRSEAKASGFDGEDLDRYVASYLESLLKLDDDEVLVRVKDPNKRIQEISYVTASGETKHVSTRDDDGFMRLSTWGDKPQPDWKLRVSMTTPKNIVRQPFVLTDVPLP
jgi:hypothetical protein